jgi:alpha-beta hydrolase superfamily lysophospholipase
MSTWILLRGLTREQGHWGNFPSLMASACPPGTQILTPDLPGNGVLHHSDSPTNVEAMVAHLRHTLSEQGHRPPYRVMAMSLGAMVTVAWAHQHPHELERCVLINTSLRPYSPFWQRLRPAQYLRIAGLILGRASDTAWESAIMAMTTRHPLDADATLARWLQLRAQHPVKPLNGLKQLWAATRYKAPKTPPPAPTLLLNSLGDQLVNPQCSATLAQHWHCPFVRHPTAGHDLPLDAGPWVLAQVQAWLAPDR